MNFVRDAWSKNQDTVGVMFIMTIDPSQISTSTTPFAMIDEYTAVRGEEEILFTMHTVFRVSTHRLCVSCLHGQALSLFESKKENKKCSSDSDSISSLE